jgi:hypothetical protein
MSENIASFDSFETDSQIAAHQSGLVRIVLEGNTDVLLFQRFWFPHRQDVFEFVEASRVATASGCTGVSEGVAQSLQQGIPAVGIVDRDTLFRQKNWDLLFSLDAAALNSSWSDEGIYVASRWEVEAYLLEADRLADWVGVTHQTPPASAEACQRALTNTLEACEVLLSVAAYFAAEHEEGRRVDESMFCDQAQAKVLAVCNNRLENSMPSAKQAAERVTELIGIIRHNQPAGEGERLQFLLRYVDTKRLFKRLMHTLSLRKDAHWTLAGFMTQSGQRPSELDSFLSQVEARFTSWVVV